jgi:hypothetical protein
LAFTPDGRALATGEYWEARLWDLRSKVNRRLWPLEGREVVERLAFAPDGQWLATSGGQRDVWLLSPASAAPPRALSRGLGDLTFSHRSSVLAYVGDRGLIHFWAVAGQRDLGTLRLLGASPSALAFSPDERHLAVGTEGGVMLWPWRELLGLAP